MAYGHVIARSRLHTKSHRHQQTVTANSPADIASRSGLTNRAATAAEELCRQRGASAHLLGENEARNMGITLSA
jgi:hypothetical protein